MPTGIAVPNDVDAAFGDQAELDNGDIGILAGDLYGVTSGCAVTAQAVPNFTVAYAAGRVIVAGLPVVVAAGNLALANPTSNPRFDLVVVNAAGVVSALSGTASTNARFPTITDGFTVLAAVYSPVGALSYTNNHIVDKRVFLAEAFRRILPSGASTFLSSRIAGQSTDSLQVDGNGKHTWGGDASLDRSALGTLRFQSNLTIQRMGLVGTAGQPTLDVRDLAGSNGADIQRWTGTQGNVIARVTSNSNVGFEFNNPISVRGALAGNGAIQVESYPGAGNSVPMQLWTNVDTGATAAVRVDGIFRATNFKNNAGAPSGTPGMLGTIWQYEVDGSLWVYTTNFNGAITAATWRRVQLSI